MNVNEMLLIWDEVTWNKIECGRIKVGYEGDEDGKVVVMDN